MKIILLYVLGLMTYTAIGKETYIYLDNEERTSDSVCYETHGTHNNRMVCDNDRDETGVKHVGAVFWPVALPMVFAVRNSRFVVEAGVLVLLGVGLLKSRTQATRWLVKRRRDCALHESPVEQEALKEVDRFLDETQKP